MTARRTHHLSLLLIVLALFVLGFAARTTVYWSFTRVEPFGGHFDHLQDESGLMSPIYGFRTLCRWNGRAHGRMESRWAHNDRLARVEVSRHGLLQEVWSFDSAGALASVELRSPVNGQWLPEGEWDRWRFKFPAGVLESHHVWTLDESPVRGTEWNDDGSVAFQWRGWFQDDTFDAALDLARCPQCPDPALREEP